MAEKDKNFDYFLTHHDEIFAKYPNQFVVIKDNNVVISAMSFEEAFEMALSQNLEVGTFIIQECTEGDSAYTQTFHSRVVFA